MADNSTTGVKGVSPDKKARPAKTIGRRIWWVCKLGLKAVAVVIALAVLAWIFEDIRWSWRLEQQLEEYRAAGLPTKVEDFNKPPVPEDQNGVPLYKKAAESYKLTSLQEELVAGFKHPRPKLKDNMDLMAQAIAANAEPLQLLRKARSKSHYDWEIKFRDPLVVTQFPLGYFSRGRDMVRFLHFATRYHHIRNDDAAALECIIDMLGIGKSSRNCFLMGDLFSIATDAWAYSTIEDIAPTFNIASKKSNASAKPKNHPASRQAVKNLIRALTDEQGIHESFAATLHFDRLSAMSLLEPFIGGQVPDKADMMQMLLEYPTVAEQAKRSLLKPLYKRQLVHHFDTLAGYRRTILNHNRWPKPKKPRSRKPGEFLELISGAQENLCVLMYQGIAQRRMAAVVLALRLYEIDHGRRPETLDALVPKYLPAVPRDPFSPTGQAISYVPHGPYPLLYSIGKDQQPNDYKNLKKKPERNHGGDVVMFLTITPDD